MLKKKLVKQCEDLFEKLNLANSTISKQKDTIEALRAEVSDLEEEIERLNVLINLKEENVAEEENDETVVEVSDGNQAEETVATTAEKKEENITDYASSVIGKIVIEATKNSNKISSEGATNENKELINLILGKTEVAKSEILNIVLSNLDDNDKKISIDKIYLDSCEYFKSILLQY